VCLNVRQFWHFVGRDFLFESYLSFWLLLNFARKPSRLQSCNFFFNIILKYAKNNLAEHIKLCITRNVLYYVFTKNYKKMDFSQALHLRNIFCGCHTLMMIVVSVALLSTNYKFSSGILLRLQRTCSMHLIISKTWSKI